MAVDAEIQRPSSATTRSPAEIYSHYMTQLHARSPSGSRPASAQATPRVTQVYQPHVVGAPPAGMSSRDSVTSRRLRKPTPLYTDDAAGLTSHHRNVSRNTPLKGKGCPPPDCYEPVFKPSKRFITGRSFAAHKDILHHHEDFVPLTPPSSGSRSASSMTPSSLSKSMDSAMLSLAMRQASSASGSDSWSFGSAGRPGTASSTSSTRLCLRMTDLSHRSSLKGPGLTIIEEAPPKRALRKPGTAAPKGDTKARVLVLSEDVTPPSSPFGARGLSGLDLELSRFANNPREAMINNRWARQAFEAGLVDSFPGEDQSRPSTAPARSRSVEPCNEARRRYQESSVANLDVLARYSGGICDNNWKLDGTRMPAPHLVQHSPESAREAFYSSRAGYSTTRVRSLLSQRSYA